MASGKKNYFRHSFNARNDEFIMGLMNEFGEKGYFMWFALCEICGEMLSDGHQWPLKFNKSRLYKELRCNQLKLNLFLTYTQDKLKISSTYVEPIVSLEIPSLSKYLGKYSEISPNKRKEKERKEKEIKLNSEMEISGEKNLPEKDSQEILKTPSPLSNLFSHMPEVQAWLDNGSHDTHKLLAAKYPKQVLEAEVLDMYVWASRNEVKAESWMYKRLLSKNTSQKGSSKAQKLKGRVTPGNPDGNPYLDDNGNLRGENESA